MPDKIATYLLECSDIGGDRKIAGKTAVSINTAFGFWFSRAVSYHSSGYEHQMEASANLSVRGATIKVPSSGNKEGYEKAKSFVSSVPPGAPSKKVNSLTLHVGRLNSDPEKKEYDSILSIELSDAELVPSATANEVTIKIAKFKSVRINNICLDKSGKEQKGVDGTMEFTDSTDFKAF